MCGERRCSTVVRCEGLPVTINQRDPGTVEEEEKRADHVQKYSRDRLEHV